MKLPVKHLDFEALIKDLPKSSPLTLVYEISHVYDEHGLSLDMDCEGSVKEKQ